MVLPVSRRVSGSRGVLKFLLSGFFFGLLVGVNLTLSGSGDDRSLSFSKLSSAEEEGSHATKSEDQTYPTLSCADLFLKVEQGIVADPNNGINKHVRQTTTTPSFAISLHNKKTDKVRWSIMETGFYYERFVTEDWQAVLRDYPPSSIVLDVGMNIGWFSLWTRALGHQAVSFEPNPINQLRLCESIALNNWTTTGSVNVYDMGVGERDEKLPFVMARGDNPGAGGFVRDGGDAAVVNSGNAKKLRVVTLDGFATHKGWLDGKNMVIPLLKVDVEGLDPQVFKGASKLIGSGFIKNVMMEYSCHWGDQAEMNGVVVQLHSANYYLKKLGTWNGAAISGALEEIQGDDMASRLFQYCQKRGNDGSNSFQLNLWWALDRMQ